MYEQGTAMTSTGALSAYSGAKMGRSPLDKRVVKEPGSDKEVWWGPVNKPMTPEVSSHGSLQTWKLHTVIFAGLWSGRCRHGTDISVVPDESTCHAVTLCIMLPACIIFQRGCDVICVSPQCCDAEIFWLSGSEPTWLQKHDDVMLRCFRG